MAELEGVPWNKTICRNKLILRLFHGSDLLERDCSTVILNRTKVLILIALGSVRGPGLVSELGLVARVFIACLTPKNK